MTLDWPNPELNDTLSDANAFLAEAAEGGYTGGKLAVNTMQTIPGEIDNFIPVDSEGQPTRQAIPGWPTGDFRAGFCCQFEQTTDPNQWANIGELRHTMDAKKCTAAEAIEASEKIGPPKAV